MLDVKKEIEDKLFVGAPLSVDAMMGAYFAVCAYIDAHGEDASFTMNVETDEVNRFAANMLMEELSNISIDESTLIDEVDARRIIFEGDEFDDV